MQQDDLFSQKATVHELVEIHTAQGLLKAATNHIKEPGRNAPLDILSGRRGAKTIRTAAANAEKAAAKTLGDASQADELHAYAYAAWAHAGLPRRDLKDPSARWTVRTDYATLVVSPGVRRMADGETGDPKPLGCPSGSYARVALLDWMSQAVRNGSREVYIGKSVSDALERMSIPRSGSAINALTAQIERLAFCTISFSLEGNNGRGMFLNQQIVERGNYGFSKAVAGRGGEKRFIDSLTLTQGYYEQLMRYPVVLDPAAIVDLHELSTALDIYTWLAWRLPAIKEPTRVGWVALKAQLGMGTGAMKNFKTQFRTCLLAAHAAYRDARIELVDEGLILIPSPPPVPRKTLIAVGG